MRDYINIGCVPCDEDCTPAAHNPPLERVECRVFIKQLRRQFGEEPVGAKLKIKSFPHDFGTYLEVVCEYEKDLPESADYAFQCEAETPEKWDNKAINELASFDSRYATLLERLV